MFMSRKPRGRESKAVCGMEDGRRCPGVIRNEAALSDLPRT